ncbi:BnaC09g54450D [Brassica napus]|uniref:BnaC09g54450D protein n=1 Tax=Brassica napus TaxID=3708 RepID=A0A078J5E2_BRANA|nr:BnaC09g54450D [Brassica napus]
MPSVAVKLYSVFFKLLLKHRLQNLISSSPDDDASPDPFGVSTRSDESVAAANPSFTDGVATKDIHIDPMTSLTVRIFLPESALSPHSYAVIPRNQTSPERNESRRKSYEPYGGYAPSAKRSSRKLPVMLQFHGGGWVAGGSDSAANDFFCRRIAKVCDVIVLAVGYRLAPENRYPAAFEDGVKVLNWLGKQANLADCCKSLGHIVDAFGASMVEPWLAAHADPSRPVYTSYELIYGELGTKLSGCVLLGVSCGGNIADYVARKAVEAGKLLEPVKVVAQVLMYPFFIGNNPTQSEIKLANSYFYDKSVSALAWKLFLPEKEFDFDHPAANPLAHNRSGPPLKLMPPTLTVVAEHDWMRDRAIAYAEELRKVNVDSPVLEYKDAVHEFATLDMLLKTPQAQACAEDIAIWVKKYISLRGHEFSY